MKIKFSLLYTICLALLTLLPYNARAAAVVDIFGAAEQIVNVSIASPLLAPNTMGKANSLKLDAAIKDNLSYLPFMQLTNEKSILGGTVLDGWQAETVDFKRFQIAGSDLLITQAWPNGEANGSSVEIRVFETFSGSFIFGNAYSNVREAEIYNVADKFCADLMETLTGNGNFFKATLAFAKDRGTESRDIWIVGPTGRDLKKITNLAGLAMSPSWSPDGRYIVFSHLNLETHGLGVWDRLSNKVTRIRFPGNTVIGPSFMPDNKVAVGLSTSGYPDIFLLDYKFNREKPLEQTASINVSPTFDATGTKMAFTSSRLGGPQVFLKDLTTGSVRRVSMEGGYNTEPSISMDGTLVAYTRLTSAGHRIFVQDLLTGQEKQVTFGPGNDEHPAFAPDNYFIAYTSTISKGKSIIKLVTRHGGTPKTIPTGTGSVSFPRWGKIPEGK